MNLWCPAPRLAAALVAAAIGGCGGGVYVEFGDPVDRPPAVGLTLGNAVAAPGEIVRLAAAATDDFSVDQVAFYRIEPNGSATRLGSDDTLPYAWNAVMPNVARGVVVRFYAEAVDSRGQRTASDTVAVTAL